MNFRTSLLRSRTVLAGVLATSAIALVGCMDSDPALEGHFAEREVEPSGVKMPKFNSPDFPSAVLPTKQKQKDPNDPCALDTTTLAACLPLTTALAEIGPSISLVATENGDLLAVEPDKTPRLIANVGARVAQILPSTSVTEDGQVFVLRVDSTIARVTVFSQATPTDTPAEVRELPELSEPGILAIYFTQGKIQKLLSGDPGIIIHSVCHGPENMPLLATASLDGVPQLVQWVDGWIEPLGGVDLANDIAGCTVLGNRVAVAIPEAEKIVSMELGQTDLGTWKLTGSPNTLIDGDFGRVSHLATVYNAQGMELWGATTNTANDRQGSDSDERVIRIPSDGRVGASPD